MKPMASPVTRSLIKQQKLDNLLIKLVELWDNHSVPQFHRYYFMEAVHFNQESAEDLVEKDLKDLRSGHSSVLKLMKVTRGRERCIKLLMNAVKNIGKQSITMEIIRSVSELICHVRILTINLIEQFKVWKTQLQQPQYRYFQWLWRDWNYIIKITLDQKFLIEINALHQFFNFNVNEDIFWLSLIRQAYTVDTDYHDYLIQHKIPKSILKRIRSCEIILMEEEYQYKIYQNTRQEIVQVFEQNVQTSKKVETPMKSVKSQSSSWISTKKDKMNITRPHDLITIHSIGQLELTYFPTNYLSLPEEMDAMKNRSHESYLSTFLMVPDIYEKMLYDQDPCLFQIYKNQRHNVGTVFCSVDRDCVSHRRWVIHFIFSSEQEIFGDIIQLFLSALEAKGDASSEVTIALTHYEQNESLSECQGFKQALKQLGFKWRQQVNSPERRFTNYEKKRIQGQNVHLEPLVCQIALYAEERLEIPTITSEELMQAYFCSKVSKLIKVDPVQEKLGDLLKQIPLSAIHFKQVGSESLQEFLETAQHNFKAPVCQEAQVQLLSLCLRWQQFSVEQVDNQRMLLLSSQSDDQDEDCIIQLKSKDEKNNNSLYLVNTVDEEIVFFILEVGDKAPLNQQELQVFLERALEVYDQKVEFKDYALKIPMFTTTKSTSSIKGVQLGGQIYQSDSFFTVQYSTPLKSITSSGRAKTFKPPFIAGLIKKNIFERINKPLFAALIKQNNILMDHSPIQGDIQTTIGKLTLSLAHVIDNELPQKFKDAIHQSHPSYLYSFDSDVVSLINKSKSQQEPALLQISINGAPVGILFMYVDKTCVTARRWWIHAILQREEYEFQSLIEAVIQLVTKDTSAEEIYTYLKHHESPEDPTRLVANKYFQDTLKKVGFKWKQQTNDPITGTRLITFQYKIKEPRVVYYEPIQLKSCQTLVDALQASQIHKQLNLYESKDNELKLCEMTLLNKMNILQHSHLSDLLDQTLAQKIQKEQNYILPATKTMVNNEQQFFSPNGIQLLQLPPIRPNYQLLCQLTNLQLRWIKARDVLFNNSRYIEFPKNPDELILRGTNQSFIEPIYFISTSDPKFTLFVVECKKSEVDRAQRNLSQATRSLIQVLGVGEELNNYNQKETDNRQIVTKDLLVKQIQHDNSSVGKAIRLTITQQCIFPSISKTVSDDAIILKPPFLIGCPPPSIIILIRNHP